MYNFNQNRMKYVLLATVVGSLFLGMPASGHVGWHPLQDTLPKNQPDTTKVASPDSTAKAAADSVKKKKDEKPSIEDKVEQENRWALHAIPGYRYGKFAAVPYQRAIG
jgi:hypothetical protein